MPKISIINLTLGSLVCLSAFTSQVFTELIYVCVCVSIAVATAHFIDTLFQRAFTLALRRKQRLTYTVCPGPVAELVAEAFAESTTTFPLFAPTDIHLEPACFTLVDTQVSFHSVPPQSVGMVKGVQRLHNVICLSDMIPQRDKKRICVLLYNAGLKKFYLKSKTQFAQIMFFNATPLVATVEDCLEEHDCGLQLDGYED